MPGPIPVQRSPSENGVTFLHVASGRENLEVVADEMVMRELVEDGRAVG